MSLNAEGQGAGVGDVKLERALEEAGRLRAQLAERDREVARLTRLLHSQAVPDIEPPASEEGSSVEVSLTHSTLMQTQRDSGLEGMSNGEAMANLHRGEDGALDGEVAVKSSQRSRGVENVLSNADIARYSRQLILPEFGVKGQVALARSAVLVVGCGGLGCPAAVYLAAAGVGRLGLVDYDVIELSNLHRQVLHTEDRVDQSKAVSLAAACHRVNSRVVLEPLNIALRSDNALEVISRYDIVVDATDNVATRYLLNDACVLSHRPLISGSALRLEGQLTVYGYKGGPCYRCLYPTPPPPETVTNCSDGGVLGAVVGVIGSLQALEAIKIAADMDSSVSGRLVLFDAQTCSFRSVRLRGRQTGCAVCGTAPSITRLVDYEQFCGASATDKGREVDVLSADERVTAQEYAELCRTERHLLVDVRQPCELDICRLPSTTHNVPMDKLNSVEALADIQRLVLTDRLPVYVVCRRGNDSQLAVRRLKTLLTVEGCAHAAPHVVDIKGGLYAWAKHVDKDFPVY